MEVWERERKALEDAELAVPDYYVCHGQGHCPRPHSSFDPCSS